MGIVAGNTLYIWNLRLFLLAVLLSVIATREDEDANDDIESSSSHAKPSKGSVASNAPRLRGSEGEVTNEKSSCKCLDKLQGDPEEPACTCDLSIVDLEKDLPRLGLDRCATFGTCEACSQEEYDYGYCIRTKSRQRVVCSKCHAAVPMMPRICSQGVELFWQAAALKKVANLSVNGEHLFYRSCDPVDDDGDQAEAAVGNDASESDAGNDVQDSSQAEPRRGPLLSWHRWAGEETGEESSVGLAKEAPDKKNAGGESSGRGAPARRGPLLNGAKIDTSNSTAGSSRASHTSTVRHDGRVAREGIDESAEVMCFVALNAIAFALSFVSLRRQQRAIMAKTMGTLFDHTATTEDKRPSNDTTHLNVNLEPASAMPDSIGRSIEAVASAVARTGTAIERAVTEELTKASLASSKKN